MSSTAERHAHLDGLAVTLLVSCSLLWGLNQVAAKVAMVEVPPLTQAAVRSLGAAALVALWARLRGVPLFGRDGSLRGGLLAGALFGAEFAFIFGGLALTTASRMVVFMYLAPFIVAMGMPFVAPGERLRPVQWVGLVLAFSGVAAAFAEGLSASSAPGQWIGDAMGVAAACLWGAATLVIRGSRLTSVSPEKTLAYQLAVSGVLLGLAAAGLEQAPQQLSGLSIASLGFQTVIVSFASYLVWFWLIRHYPATRLASFTLLTPVFGLFFGVWLLDEPLTGRLLLALATVAAGIFLVNRR